VVLTDLRRNVAELSEAPKWDDVMYNRLTFGEVGCERLYSGGRDISRKVRIKSSQKK
jgi:hypothetical protein